MDILHGGLKKTNPDISSFESIYAMLNDTTAQVELKTATSLRGFIFTVTIGEDRPAPFLKYNTTSKDFDIPIRTILMKYALVARNTESIVDLPDLIIGRNTFYKESETITSFAQEAAVQSKIYRRTIIDPICPSVVDFSYFSNEDSIKLIDTLISKIPEYNKKSMQIAGYLMKVLVKGFNGEIFMLACISMELASDYESLTKIKEIYNPAIYNTICEKALLNIIRLFLLNEIDYIALYDSHTGNILGNADGNCLLIDFGCTVNVNAKLIAELKDLYKKQCEYFVKEYTNIVGITDNIDNDWKKIHSIVSTNINYLQHFDNTQKIEYIQQIIGFLFYIDYLCNKKINSSTRSFQSNRLYYNIYAKSGNVQRDIEEINTKLVNIFDKYFMFLQTDEESISEEGIFQVNEPVSQYKRDIRVIPPTTEELDTIVNNTSLAESNDRDELKLDYFAKIIDKLKKRVNGPPDTHPIEESTSKLLEKATVSDVSSISKPKQKNKNSSLHKGSVYSEKNNNNYSKGGGKKKTKKDRRRTNKKSKRRTKQ